MSQTVDPGAAWVINIEQLCEVKVESNCRSRCAVLQWDEVVEDQAAQDYKLSLLDAMEARWRAELETAQASSYYATTYSSWLSLGTSLVANIIENLQVCSVSTCLKNQEFREKISNFIFSSTKYLLGSIAY